MNFPELFDFIMLFILCVMLFLVLTQSKIPDTQKVLMLFIGGIAVVLFGFAPAVEEVGTDRARYAEMFAYPDYMIKSNFRDIGFSYYTKFCYVLTGSVIGGFVISAIIYVFSITYFYIKSNPNKYLYLLLFSFLSLEFTSYYYNGLRSGLAISFLLIAFSKNQRKKITILFSILAVSFHVSVLLVVVAYFITSKFKNTKLFISFWCVMLVALLLGVFDSFERFASLFMSMEDQRLSTYLVGDDMGYKIGLRLDFIAYSLFPILIGWYYIYKKKFRDEYYIHFYNIYLFCNACWITISKMPSNNRLAYLSWMLMPFILLYPLLTNYIIGISQKQKKCMMVIFMVVIVGINLYFKYIRVR